MSDYSNEIGTMRTFFHIGGPAGPQIAGGSGDPNNIVSGSPGDLYLDQDGFLWVKESGVGTATGWVQK